ncbi:MULTISPECIES: hypothetical protein [unclassified Leptolyngbya]|uniref:hypothetical protein n=1 Tax=unclassified Leptolyngbya TaxID=2650499 RepID=UPI00168936E9|nr:MULTISPECIES: hypothetical protein [unclassified Leptolyngbya]MBD1913703.1 hypothetical protein [Leptolyngbya sp. FACHB-8]MBD2155169.1 hypothetical protein [Leptolyngbya sp. FACHB-16]
MKKPQKVLTIALMSMMMFGGVSQTLSQTVAIAATPSDGVTMAQARRSPSSSLPRQVARRIQRDASRRFDLHPRDVQILSATRETWPDACLGLAAPNERCMMALVEGWRVTLTDGQQTWVYRTDLQARQIKMEGENSAELPPQVVDRLFTTIAQQANVPANTLRVIESEPKTFDGCMGIFNPGQACTRIAISGYRVIVMGDRQSWVYHVDQEGSRIVQNITASGSGVSITPSFIPAEGQLPLPSTDVVFKMMVSGGLRGDTTETFLTQDGVLSRTTTNGINSSVPRTTVIKRLTPQQVQQFQQLLSQQKVPNLNGMRYLTSAALADYPTTTIQAMNSTVSYIDLEESSLPQALQTVIQAWERL